jgi:hypothetical protein
MAVVSTCIPQIPGVMKTCEQHTKQLLDLLRMIGLSEWTGLSAAETNKSMDKLFLQDHVITHDNFDPLGYCEVLAMQKTGISLVCPFCAASDPALKLMAEVVQETARAGRDNLKPSPPEV